MMARTTLDIDESVMGDVRRVAEREGKSLGQVVSELLAVALARPDEEDRRFAWESAKMTARVDLEDKEAVRALLEGR